MKHDETLRWAQLKVGILILVGFLILLWVAFNSDFPSLFRSETPLRARFPSAEGLPAGAPVLFLGMEAGSVESVALDPALDPEPDRPPIAVTFTVSEEVRPLLRADAFVRVASFGILGDKYLELAAGEAAEPLPEDAVLRSRSQAALTDLLEPSRRTLTKVEGLLTELEAISIGVREDLQGGEGSLGKLLNEDELHDRLLGTLEETRATLTDFRRTQAQVGARLASTAGSIDSLVSGFREGDGTLNRLAEDPALYQNLNAASARLERVLAQVQAGDGLFARLLDDPLLADQFTGVVVDLRALLKDLREHPGRYVSFSVF